MGGSNNANKQALAGLAIVITNMKSAAAKAGEGVLLELMCLVKGCGFRVVWRDSCVKLHRRGTSNTPAIRPVPSKLVAIRWFVLRFTARRLCATLPVADVMPRLQIFKSL